MSTFNIKQGDYHRRLVLVLDGLDATSATGVTFRMKSLATGALVFSRAGTKDSGSQVSFAFQSPELETAGRFALEAALTFADGPETVPTEGYVDVLIEPKIA